MTRITEKSIALLIVAFAAVAAAASFARAQDDAEQIFSGPQAGEKLPSLKVVGVYGDLAGKELDFVKDAGEKPLFLLFVHKLTRPSVGLVRQLTGWARDRGRTEATAAAKADEKVLTRIVWLTDDRSGAEQYLTRARGSLKLDVPVGISPDGLEGPGSYGLNRKVTLTILVGEKGKVKANFALVQPSDTDAPRILAEVAKLIGEKPPTAEEIARYGPRYNSRKMRREGARPGAGERDPKLVSLLRSFIQKDNTDERVDELAREITAYVKENAKARTQLGEITNRVVGSPIFEKGGYGTKHAHGYLKRWAKAYGPKREAEKKDEAEKTEKTEKTDTGKHEPRKREGDRDDGDGTDDAR